MSAGGRAAAGRQEIRGAAPDDAEAIARLATELGYPSTAADVARRLEGILRSADDVALVAVARDAGVVGFIHGAVARRLESDAFAEIGGLVVASGAQRRGVGRMLVAAVEAWARRKGLPRIRVRCREDRHDAHRFYEGLGYAGTKTQRVFGKSLESEGVAGTPATPQ